MLMKRVEYQTCVDVDSSGVGVAGFSSHKSGGLTEGGESQGGPDTYQLLIRMLKRSSCNEKLRFLTAA